jgi:GNAT superfamily N-acetyltransferase
MMVASDYYKILTGGRIIGGFIVRLRGYQYYELVRIFIQPDFQNQGVGTRAFEFLWSEYPDVERWTLGTPAWNHRTRHFYKKVGFAEVGEDSRGGILFERNVTLD